MEESVLLTLHPSPSYLFPQEVFGPQVQEPSSSIPPQPLFSSQWRGCPETADAEEHRVSTRIAARQRWVL